MWNDFRFALRTLRRSPGFAFVAVASLALGIGANAAIFSLLYQVALRSIPINDPEKLVSLQSDDYTFGWTRRDNNATVFSYPMYRALRDHNQVFSGLIGRALFPANLAWRGDAMRGYGEVVTGNFFEVLGLKPAVGRLLRADDDGVPGQNPVIVLSYSCWTSRLGRDPNVLNSRVLMNGQPVLIVGVAPQGFRGLVAGQTPDFFAPVSMTAMIEPGWKGSDSPDSFWLNLFGRLRPAVGPRQADAMLLPLFRSILADELPQFDGVTEESRKKLLAKTLSVAPAGRGLNEFGDRWQGPLLVLMVMVGLVLLIACTNVANLLVARATVRQREFALRLALGASGWQVVRQLLVENLILTLTGALMGVFVSRGLTAGLLSFLPTDESGGWLAAQLDLLVLGFSIALSLLTGLLFGLVPAIQMARPDVAPALKEQGTGISAGGSQPRIRQSLVVAQIGLSLLLLIGAGLFTRRLVNLISVDPGFRPEHLITFSADPSLSGYSRDRTVALFHEAQERLGALPAVRSVAGAALTPFGGFGWGSGVKVPGSRRASDQYADCGENAVSPGYFRTFGIPLLMGREFDVTDRRNSPKTAIINEALARYLFEKENPLGRHMLVGGTNDDVQIVGVVQDSKYGDVREKPDRFLYVPFEQDAGEFVKRVTLFVRTSGNDRAVVPAVRTVMRQLDHNVPIEHLTSLKDMIDDSIYRDRLLATLAVAFGVLATVLAAVGLYGTVSFTVTRRTREFGIRLALGAVPQKLLLAVMRDVGWLVAAGIAVGLPLSYLLAWYAESKVDGLDAFDPWVLGGAMLVIATAALCATLAPALRAMRIEPVRALKYE